MLILHNFWSIVLILFDWQFLVKHKNVQVQHPPNSPDLVLYNIFLYPKMKIYLKSKILAYEGH